MRVLTIGTFDTFHYGHINLLRRCHELAGLDGEVIVGVNDSAFVKRFKGVVPLHSNGERMDFVRSIRFTAAAFIHYGREDAALDIMRWHVSVIAVGDDWQDRDYPGQLGVTQDWLDARRIRVVYLPRTAGVSSTQLREASSI